MHKGDVMEESPLEKGDVLNGLVNGMDKLVMNGMLEKREKKPRNRIRKMSLDDYGSPNSGQAEKRRRPRPRVPRYIRDALRSPGTVKLNTVNLVEYSQLDIKANGFEKWLEPLHELIHVGKADPLISPRMSNGKKIDGSSKKEDLSVIFKEQLLKQEIALENEKSAELKKIKAEMVADMKAKFAVEITEEMSGVFEKHISSVHRVENQKPDVKYNASQWNVQRLMPYIENKDIHLLAVMTKPNLSMKHMPRYVLHNIREGFNECGGVQTEEGSQPSDLLNPLFEFKYREEAVRGFLNALLFPICASLGIKALVEETISGEGFPSTRYDYLLVNSQNKIIGVVEAKDGGQMKPNSVIQLILQLVSLQKNARSRENLFGVVSDGMHYVIVYLQGDALLLETVERTNVAKVRTVRTWEDLNALARVLFCICFNSFNDDE